MSKVRISLIVAIGENNEIGRNNELLWRLKDDLKLFKSTTLGHPIIMGRKSFESIGRPLPGRRNIVITRNEDYKVEGVEMVYSVEESIALCSGEDAEPFFIGGGEIYKLVLPFVDTMYISRVKASFPDAETFFPEINWSNWELTNLVQYGSDERNEFAFDFCVYKRK